MRYIHWFYQPWTAELTWDGEIQKTTTIKSGVSQGSPLVPVLFLIGVAKVFEKVDLTEITSHKFKTYSYINDFNCTTEHVAPTRRGRHTALRGGTKPRHRGPASRG